MLEIERTSLRLAANLNRVAPLFLELNEERSAEIINRVISLKNNETEEKLEEVIQEFGSRHFEFEDVLLSNYQKVINKTDEPGSISTTKKLLIGALFTKEYSVESAALFNPSIVSHPDNEDEDEGHHRFVMSLRSTGEGHISSISFVEGLINNQNEIILDSVSEKVVLAKKVSNLRFSKKFVKDRLKYFDNINLDVLYYFPDHFSMLEAVDVFTKIENNTFIDFESTKIAIAEIFDTNYDVIFDKNIPVGNRVVFPISNGESVGMEDVRFVKLNQENPKYVGTFTAYNGKDICVKLILTNDFNEFKVRSLYGDGITDKGMALFPEKINGKYVMVGRQGGSCLTIMYSDDLIFWDNFNVIQRPERIWELTQIGNCGSPVKTPDGWLLLTHAVGPMRKYVISATLLDLNNPEIVIASLDKPLLSPNSEEREGYVPNVVYTCGVLAYKNNLVIPYAMSDSKISVAKVELNSLLNELTKNTK